MLVRPGVVVSLIGSQRGRVFLSKENAINELLTSLNTEVMSRYTPKKQHSFWKRMRRDLHDVIDEGVDAWHEDVIEKYVPKMIKTLELLVPAGPSPL